MAKRRANAKTTRPQSPGSQVAAAFVFNFGLALFAAGAGWYLVAGPAISWSAHWWRVALCSVGLAIAGPGWITGSRLATSTKVLIAALVVVAVLGLTWAAERDFSADDQVLKPWRREGNHLVHDGLGLSVAFLPGWKINLQPKISDAVDSRETDRTRLWFGEEAVFLAMAHERPGPGEAHIGSSLMIRGGPETFGSLHQALVVAHNAERVFAEQPGATILSTTRIRDLHGMEVLMFEGSDPQGATWHHVFFRSGSYLLHLTICVADAADRGPIVGFLNSIRVNGRDTTLND
jgi:hypothetical protein